MGRDSPAAALGKGTASAMSPSVWRATMAVPPGLVGRTWEKAPGCGSKFRREWPMRVLIVDDEAPARTRLRQMLAAHGDVELAGEAETGPQAMELAAQLKPDV